LPKAGTSFRGIGLNLATFLLSWPNFLPIHFLPSSGVLCMKRILAQDPTRQKAKWLKAVKMYAERTSQKPLWPTWCRKIMFVATHKRWLPAFCSWLSPVICGPTFIQFFSPPPKRQKGFPQTEFCCKEVGPLSGDGSLGVSLDALFLPQVLEVN